MKWTSLSVTVTKMTGLSSVTCVLLLGLQLTGGVLGQYRGQWGQWGLGGAGGYFQRPRAQRFAAYGGYPGVRGRVSLMNICCKTLLGSVLMFCLIYWVHQRSPLLVKS